MSKTVAQIYAINPTTTVADTDLYYLVQSPYTPGSDAAITGASLKAAFGSGGTINPGLQNQLAWYAANGSIISGLTSAINSVLTTNAIGVPGFTSFVSTGGTYGDTNNIVARDANGNSSFNNEFFATKSNAAGSAIILTAASAKRQTFSGVGASTLQLPNATTLPNGATYHINNNTSGIITVLLNDGITVLVNALVGCDIHILLSSNVSTNGVWDWHWLLPANGASGTIYMANGILAGYRFSTATYPFTTTINQLLYSSAANTITGLATANNSVLVTSAGGVPSLSTTLPSGLTIPGFAASGSNADITSMSGLTGAISKPTTITFATGGAIRTDTTATNTLLLQAYNTNTLSYVTFGTLTANNPPTFDLSASTTIGGSIIAVSPLTTKGDIWAFSTVNDRFPVATGDGKILQVSSGATFGLAWSTATLPSTATGTGTILRADGTNWVATTATYPSATTINRLLYSSANNTVNELTTAINGLLVTSNVGVPSILDGPGTTGNFLQSNAAAAPSWSTSIITLGGNFTTSGAFTTILTVTGNTNVTLPTSGTLLTSASINAYEAEGRLTLTSNVPVTTADVTAATTLYYTPYIGDHIALFDGVSTWTTITFTQLSIAVPATTSTMYDVWIFNNSGAATLELLAWTNDTTRATALTYQNGILVKTGATTRRYVGSIRTTTVSGQTEDSAIKRYVWNYYNRVTRYMAVVDTTNSWTYTLVAFRQANGSAANQLDCVIGVSEDQVFASSCGAASQGGASIQTSVGVGINSTTVNSAQTRPSTIIATGGGTYHSVCNFVGVLPVGRNTLVWLESSQASGTTTWQGDNGSTFVQTGIVGNLRG